MADSIKVGNWQLGIGHLGIPNNAMICGSVNQTIASYYPIPMPKATFIEPAAYKRITKFDTNLETLYTSLYK